MRDTEGWAAEALGARHDVTEALVEERRPRTGASGVAVQPQGLHRAVRRRHLEREVVLDERRVAQWLRQRGPGRPAKRTAREVLEELARRVRARAIQPDP